MPIKLLDRQRAVARIGNIRMGEVRTSERTGGTYPAQRETFRFTTANKTALEMVQQTYKGELRPWKDHPGEWELDTKSNQISVIVDTAMSVDEQFTRYDGKTRTHKCDGCECHFVDLVREGKKITSCTDRGMVKCLCDPEGLGWDLPDDDRKCDLVTTLRVILPASGDIVLWQFASHGKTFNREVFGTIDSIRSMGMKQAYCLLTINLLEQTIGNEVKKFGVARLSLDPNPPNFMAALLARTPYAQMMEAAKALGTGAQELPAPSRELPPPVESAAAEPRKRKEPQTPEEHAIVFLVSVGFDQQALREFDAWLTGENRKGEFVAIVEKARAEGAKSVEHVHLVAQGKAVPAASPFDEGEKRDKAGLGI